MRGWGLLSPFIGAALAGLIAPDMVPAQQAGVVRGMVVDSATRRPIAGARVALFETPSVGARIPKGATVTDSAGRFRLTAERTSPAVLEFRHIGFVAGDVVLDAVWPDTLVVALARSATTLDEVRVVEKKSFSVLRLERSGFFSREEAGNGRFLDSARIARTKAKGFVALLRPYLKGCTMVFIDGIPGYLTDVSLSTVIGIEVYASNNTAPPQFHNPVEGMGRCGSIVIWR